MTHNQKIEYLSKYAAKRFRVWQKKYGENIVGVHVGHKRIKNKKIKRYSIVFHVISKGKLKSQQIPESIKVSFPDNTMTFIPTDVIETGKLKLTSIGLSDRIRNTSTVDFGGVGLFFYNENNIYALSNMHVLGPDIVFNQALNEYFLAVENQHNPNIEVYNNGDMSYGYLEEGRFDQIDVAIARMGEPEKIDNNIYDYGEPIGYRIVNRLNFNSIKIFIAGSKSGEMWGNILDIGISRDTHINNVTLDNLILTDIPVDYGDSGSPVLDSSMRIIGIVEGKDSFGSYIIPIKFILNEFPHLHLLTNPK